MLERIGKYEIRKEIGRGAMGAVYEGFDTVLGRRVAVKKLRMDLFNAAQLPAVLARFKREAQSAGGLSHPHIVTIHDYGEAGGTPYIVMEYIAGQELGLKLDQGSRFSLDDIERIMSQLLGALSHAHAHGVVHRDLKPANMFLLPNGALKVVDFGIARVESSSLTDTGTMLGTPAYMSPEQCLGTHVDHRSDLYSAGVILYQLLTGDKPFTGSVTSIIQKVLRQNPLPPSELNPMISPVWDRVVARAMAKKPESRYESADQFAEAIKAVRKPGTSPRGDTQEAAHAMRSGSATATVPSTNSPRPLAKASPRHRRSYVLPLMAVAVLVGAGAAYVHRPALLDLLDRSPPTPAPLVDQEQARRAAEERTRRELEEKVAAQRAAERLAAETAVAERAAAERAAAESAAAERAIAEKTAADKAAASRAVAMKLAADRAAAERAAVEKAAADRAASERAAVERAAAEKVTAQRIAAEVEIALKRAAERAAADKAAAENAAAAKLAGEKAAAEKARAERAAADRRAAEQEAAEKAAAEEAAVKAELERIRTARLGNRPDLDGKWFGTATDSFGVCPAATFKIGIDNGSVEGTVEWQDGTRGTVSGYVSDDGVVRIGVHSPDLRASSTFDLVPSLGRLTGRDEHSCSGGRVYNVSLGRG